MEHRKQRTENSELINDKRDKLNNINNKNNKSNHANASYREYEPVKHKDTPIGVDQRTKCYQLIRTVIIP